MEIDLKKYNLKWFPMFLLLISAGSLGFVFFRKELLFFTFFLFVVLFFIRGLYKGEIFRFFQLTVLFISLLLVNYYFAIVEQSTQKLFANILIFICSIFAALYYSREENKSQFVKHLRFILKLVLFHSIINFFIYPYIELSLVEIANERYNCLTFNNIFFYLGETHLIKFSSFEMARNQGIFWEPGILQIFMNLLLFIEAFIYKRRGFIFWLSILSIITTFSTTGLLVMFIQLVLFFFTAFKQNIYISTLILGVIGITYFITAANVQNKILGDGQVSFQARFFDLVQPLYILADNPITGVGLDDEQYISTRQKTSYSLNLEAIDFTNRKKGSTNSVTFFLAAAGIPFFVIVFYLMYTQQFILEKRLWFFIFIVISLMSEPLLLRPFFLIFVMSGAIHFFDKFRWKEY